MRYILFTCKMGPLTRPKRGHINWATVLMTLVQLIKLMLGPNHGRNKEVVVVSFCD